eukprot:COSAG06_NODE_3342_length_5481_cov_2.258826_10_plen_206_part_00
MTSVTVSRPTRLLLLLRTARAAAAAAAAAAATAAAAAHTATHTTATHTIGANNAATVAATAGTTNAAARDRRNGALHTVGRRRGEIRMGDAPGGGAKAPIIAIQRTGRGIRRALKREQDPPRAAVGGRSCTPIRQRAAASVVHRQRQPDRGAADPASHLQVGWRRQGASVIARGAQHRHTRGVRLAARRSRLHLEPWRVPRSENR